MEVTSAFSFVGISFVWLFPSLLSNVERNEATLDVADSRNAARDSGEGSFPSISSRELRKASLDFLLVAQRIGNLHELFDL